jgi:hypothetical protein
VFAWRLGGRSCCRVNRPIRPWFLVEGLGFGGLGWPWAPSPSAMVGWQCNHSDLGPDRDRGMLSATGVIEVDHRVTAFWRFLAVSSLCQALCAPMAGWVRLPKPWSGDRVRRLPLNEALMKRAGSSRKSSLRRRRRLFGRSQRWVDGGDQ